MDHHNDDRTPDELLHMAERLRRNRPQATALELDQMKQRVRTRMSAASATGARSRKGTPMKSRIAMTALLVCGMLMSGTGATLALSGNSGSGSAAEAQYPPPVGTPGTQGTAPPLGSPPSAGGEEGEVEGGTEPPASLPDEEGSAPDEDVAQVPRQVVLGAESGTDTLPFTGFAAIPILLLGVAMLATGLLVRRRANGAD
jgi:hypothetical protein